MQPKNESMNETEKESDQDNREIASGYWEYNLRFQEESISNLNHLMFSNDNSLVK